MAFAIVLPPDTQTELDEYVDTQFATEQAQLAAAGALDRALEILAANPTIGAVPVGTPFETRRIYRATLDVDGEKREVEFLYKLNKQTGSIVVHGFRAVPRNIL